jgi:hypothetical protein
MFDPNLMNAANARHQHQLQASLKQYEIQQHTAAGPVPSASTPSPLRGSLFTRLGHWLVACGQWLETHDPLSKILSSI